MFANDADLLHRIAAALLRRHECFGTAESCTGGLIAAACTDLPGSSQWFERGVVTYSNEAKTELLGVPAALIARHGAVSAEVAERMAAGLLERAPLHWALAVTGIAGPTGAAPRSRSAPSGWHWRSGGSRCRCGVSCSVVIARRCAFRRCARALARWTARCGSPELAPQPSLASWLSAEMMDGSGACQSRIQSMNCSCGIGLLM